MTLPSFVNTLNRTIGASIGSVITDVIYRTYEETTPESAVSEGAGWMHGEVLLVFPNVPKLFIGWGENEGWPDQFSLHPSETTTYEPGRLVDLPALDAPEWLPVREQVLTTAELRGSNGTPHLIVLHFGSDGVVIGDGYDREFEDGDPDLGASASRGTAERISHGRSIKRRYFSLAANSSVKDFLKHPLPIYY